MIDRKELARILCLMIEDPDITADFLRNHDDDGDGHTELLEEALAKGLISPIDERVTEAGLRFIKAHRQEIRDLIHNSVHDRLMQAITNGLVDYAAGVAQERDTFEEAILDILLDHNQVVVVSKDGDLYMFRLKLERL